MWNSSAALYRWNSCSAVRKQCCSCWRPSYRASFILWSVTLALCTLTCCMLHFPRHKPASSPGRTQLGTWVLLKKGKETLFLCVMRFRVPSGYADVQTWRCLMQLCRLCARSGSAVALVVGQQQGWTGSSRDAPWASDCLFSGLAHLLCSFTSFQVSNWIS